MSLRLTVMATLLQIVLMLALMIQQRMKRLASVVAASAMSTAMVTRCQIVSISVPLMRIKRCREYVVAAFSILTRILMESQIAMINVQSGPGMTDLRLPWKIGFTLLVASPCQLLAVNTACVGAPA
jgi:hypothetical protein